MIQMSNQDCMTALAQLPDKAFELAIVDPPYFENGGDSNYYRSRVKGHEKKILTGDAWKIPDKAYFDELFRVSKKQIIWGCNYYSQYIPHSGRIVWDKCNDNTPFSQCDLASYSEGVKIWLFRYKWNGMLQQDMKNKEDRIHPTQKPVALYKWLLQNYAKPGDRILDTHGGSGSICIACHDLGFDLDWMELDADYYASAVKRYEKHKSQLNLFTPDMKPAITQDVLL